MFGTRRIVAELSRAGELIVRVGGGFLGFGEFVARHGESELLKFAKLHGESAFK